MAAGVAAAQRNGLIDAYVGRTTYTANAGFFLKLHTGDPGAAGTTAPAGETTRQSVTFGSAAAAGAISNTVAVTWTNVSTAETLAWVSAWTAVTAGTWLGNAQLAVARTVAIGDTFTIAIGDFDITSTGA